MNRLGLASVAIAVAALGVVGASCGADELSDGTLPPMYTTTTSTTLDVTTTEVPASLYEVQSGDQLGNIARAWGVDMDELMALNGITNPDKIEVGQVLKIPPSTAPVSESLPAP